MSERKINLLIAVAGLNIGGAEVVIQHLVRAIDRRRFNVTVGCIKVSGVIGDELARNGVEVVVLSRFGESKPDYFAFLRMWQLIRRKRIDVIHSHTTDALADAAVCRLLAPGVKLVHTFHFGNYPHLGKRQMWLERVFARLATRLIAVGEVQREQVKAAYHIRDASIGRVWNGVPLVSTRPDGSFRARMGASDRVMIGTIATLTQQKGLADLLKVAQRFRDSEPRVRFVIVGDGHLRAQLETMRQQFGLDDVVTFAGWIPDAARVALPEFDVFFQPSLWEAMSIAILEAMAAGKAIVATRVGENPSVIDHEIDGLLAEPGDVDGMTDSLRRLVDDPVLRQRIAAAAHQKVAREFTVDRMARAYEEVYLDTM